MNNSNAAAKRRRANIQPNTPPTTSNTPANPVANQPTPNPSGLTLPQVIALIDTRLVTLEKFMKETKDAELNIPDIKQGDDNNPDAPDAVFMDSKEFTDFVEEVNNRFQLFADEINSMKEIVLKLQTYTMDVNKLLLSELSFNGKPVPNISFEIEDKNDDITKTEETYTLESQTTN